MKKMPVLLVAVALSIFTASCSSDDIALDGSPVENTPQQTYTLIVQATKGDNAALSRALAAAGGDITDAPTTRALSPSADGKTLNASWNEGDMVLVFKGRTYIGSLTAGSVSADRQSCTFSGTLNASYVSDAGGISDGDELTLSYNDPNAAWNLNSEQDGTLDNLALHFDHAVATVKVGVEGVDGGYSLSSASPAVFVNQYAIVRFSAKNKSGEAVATKRFNISIGSRIVLVTAPGGSKRSEWFVALPAASNERIEIDAWSDPTDATTYRYEKTAVTLAQGSYYDISVKMERLVFLNVASVYENGEFVAQHGDVLKGSVADEASCRISIADGATVTLQGATIGSSQYAGITPYGNATIILEGENSVSGGAGYPAIFALPNKTLTIKGDGNLVANGSTGTNGGAAGIGCNFSGACGNIVIEGGTINATGADGAPGIGGGTKYAGANMYGTITITGGNVTAQGGSNAPGIGGWYSNHDGYASYCGVITISSNVYVTKGSGANYCIGAANGGECDGVIINNIDYWNSYSQGLLTSSYFSNN